MQPQQWSKIKEIYSDAREREPGERAAFLEQACGGDEELRREVESLLASRSEAPDFIEVPAFDAAAMARTAKPPASVDLTGQTFLHYRIIKKIGEGGMGELFLAEDTLLRRKVALKFLPPAMQRDETAHKRFIREARSAAALDHPYICQIHEVAESNGQDFIVMEYVDGQSLKERIEKGPMQLDEVLPLAIEVAEALEAAHSIGIIHRDIKPANIMLTQTGHAKVMDFGLAKRFIPSGGVESGAETVTTLTVEGSTVGTLAYMSPEQLRCHAADVRSDIWALGVTLYEMVSGVRPFQGQSGAELTSAILNQAPRPLPSQVPADLGAVIERCLNKDPTKRYQQASEVREALEAIRGGRGTAWAAWPYRLRHHRRWVLAISFVLLVMMTTILYLGLRQSGFWGGAAKIQSLAVLPLANLSGDKEQEYFADGMTEQLISDLSRIHSVKVISRFSAMRYKKVDLPLQEIASELKVDGIVTGSVQRSGGLVKISVQLIRVANDTNLWAESYERDPRDVLTMQGEVAQDIAREIKAVLTPEAASRLARARTVNPEAYDDYLKGQFYWYRISPGDLDMAFRYFQSALEKDPQYAPAYVGIAHVWFMRSDTGLIPPSAAIPKGREALHEALKLDESLAEAHIILGNLLALTDRDWAAGEREYRRGLELDPNNAFGHQMYADFLIAMKRQKEWEVEAQHALELDPFSPFFQWVYGWELVYVGRYDEAIAHLRKVLNTEPRSSSAHLGLWGAYYRKGMQKEAFDEAKKHFEIINEPAVVDALTRGYSQGGYTKAMSLAASVLAAEAKQKYVPGVRLARMYAHAGENDQAIHWLNVAIDRRESPLSRLAVFWDWDNLRSDPRFQEMLRRLKLPQ